LSASTTGADGDVTSLGVALGTPAYMSPEQAAASPNVDARADIYAWGIMAYEMFAGHAPFAGRTLQAMLAAHVIEAPELITKLRPNLPSGLASLIMRCLEKHAADRPQSAAELVHTLDGISTPTGGSDPATRPEWMSSASDARTRSTGRRRQLAGIVIGALFVAALVAGVVLTRGPGGAFRPTSATGEAEARSIAVLPFINAGGNPEDEYFSDGLAEQLITALSLPGLRVMSRSSSFAYKGRPLTGRQIGESLHVTSVLEAQVRRAGNRLRLTAQLVKVADGSTLWSQTYNREMADVFAVQDEIARSIASELRVAYDPSASPLASRGTKDLVAYDLYLKGLFDSNQRTQSGIRRGIAYFEQAIARDSTYALAYVGLADAHLLSQQYASVPGNVSTRLGEAAAREALSLDSTLAEARATLASIHGERYQWREAEEEFKRAIALRPDYARAHHWYVNSVLRPMGRFDSAQAVIQRALELDPSSPAIWTNTALNLSAMGEHAKAVEQMERIVKRFPDSPRLRAFMGTAYGLNGQHARAEAEFRVADAALENATGLELAWLYGLMGRRAEADSIIRIAEQRAATEYISPYALAKAYVAVGRRDRAFQYLDKAVDMYEGYTLGETPQLAPLRTDPRFAALLKRINLAP
jgi:serine/threonine-protein kinase